MMALAGDGAILIWNDITDAGRDEFYAWHVAEHIPERVAIPGFLSGRRFVATDGATEPEFFTLYETDTEAVLTSAPYLARLNAPTDWTRRATAAFRNTQRALTGVVARCGAGNGGVIVTMRLRLTDPLEAGRSMPGLVDALGALPLVTGAAYCRTDGAASAGRTVESATRTDIETPPDHALLIEACTPEAARAAADRAAELLAPLLAERALTGIYRLEYALVRHR